MNVLCVAALYIASAQATNPVVVLNSINSALAHYASENVDDPNAYSVVKSFLWDGASLLQTVPYYSDQYDLYTHQLAQLQDDAAFTSKLHLLATSGAKHESANSTVTATGAASSHRKGTENAAMQVGLGISVVGAFAGALLL